MEEKIITLEEGEGVTQRSPLHNAIPDLRIEFLRLILQYVRSEAPALMQR